MKRMSLLLTRESRSAPLGISVAIVAWFLSMPLGAETIHVNPQSRWFETLHGNGLNPGDEILLAPGVYSDPRHLKMNHRGTKAKPIVIRAMGAVLKRPDARQNSINMAGC